MCLVYLRDLARDIWRPVRRYSARTYGPRSRIDDRLTGSEGLIAHAKLAPMKDPLGLAGRSFYLPDISPEELERRIAADTRKAILDEEMEEAGIARLLR